jgi:hypothetical protein
MADASGVNGLTAGDRDAAHDRRSLPFMQPILLGSARPLRPLAAPPGPGPPVSVYSQLAIDREGRRGR